MVEFNGQINASILKYFKKVFRSNQVKGSYLGMLVLLPVFIFVAIILKKWAPLYFYILTLLFGLPISLAPASKSMRDKLLPTSLSFSNNEIIATFSNGTVKFEEIENVKKVVDHGCFYEILFYDTKTLQYCYCQKNLISKGTLDDFEELFKEKIIRNQSQQLD